MSLVSDKLIIRQSQQLFQNTLKLPEYQRPYSWSNKSANTLFSDTYRAYKSGIQEYRLGSVILHFEDNTHVYNIVDGQQRLTTLSMLLYCLNNECKEINQFLDLNLSTLSNDAIVSNYRILLNRVNELTESDRAKYRKYLLENCTFVQVVTNCEQEAFQFFDSQNSRGKALAPHDLLKSYHLREMNNETQSAKINIVNNWEDLDQNNLHILFESYLYPLIKWYKRNSGLGYGIKTIDVFKGVKAQAGFNYANYHQFSHLYAEQLNLLRLYKNFNSKELNQFQLTQPLIAGSRFFSSVQHYHNLLKQIKDKITKYHKEGEIPTGGSGDSYTQQLYECSLLFFADRFNLESLTPPIMHRLYLWSYSIRLVMYAVYQQTINKYAQGKHDKINSGIALFDRISEMNEPEELMLIDFEQIDADKKVEGNNKEKYKAKYKAILSKLSVSKGHNHE